MNAARLLAGLLLPLLAVVAQGQDPATITRRIDDHYNHLSSLKTRFVEVYKGLGIERQESGTLLLKKPGRTRWSYDEPAGKVFLIDGKFAWTYAPGDAQVQRIAAKKIDDLRSPLRLLLGHTQLAKELDRLAVRPEAGGFRVSGVPRGMEQRVRQLSLETDATGAIRRIVLEEIDGATTSFFFTGMEENLPLRDSDFVFTRPAGVPVVEGLPPI